jgi:hypothetical protein
LWLPASVTHISVKIDADSLVAGPSMRTSDLPFESLAVTMRRKCLGMFPPDRRASTGRSIRAVLDYDNSMSTICRPLILINPHMCNARLPKAERYGGFARNVDDSATHRRTSPNDRDDHATAVSEVEDPHPRSLSASCGAPRPVPCDENIENVKLIPVLPLRTRR